MKKYLIGSSASSILRQIFEHYRKLNYRLIMPDRGCSQILFAAHFSGIEIQTYIPEQLSREPCKILERQNQAKNVVILIVYKDGDFGYFRKFHDSMSEKNNSKNIVVIEDFSLCPPFSKTSISCNNNVMSVFSFNYLKPKTFAGGGVLIHSSSFDLKVDVDLRITANLFYLFKYILILTLRRMLWVIKLNRLRRNHEKCIPDINKFSCSDRITAINYVLLNRFVNRYTNTLTYTSDDIMQLINENKYHDYKSYYNF